MRCEQCGKNKAEEPMLFEFSKKDGTKIKRIVCRKCFWDLSDTATTIVNLDAIIKRGKKEW